MALASTFIGQLPVLKTIDIPVEFLVMQFKFKLSRTFDKISPALFSFTLAHHLKRLGIIFVGILMSRAVLHTMYE